MDFFTRWLTSDHMIVLCFGTPASLQVSLESALQLHHNQLDLSSPDCLHASIVDEIISLYDESVWALRDVIRNLEKVRGGLSIQSV